MTVPPLTSTTEHRGIDAAFPEVRETPAPSPWSPSRGAPPAPDERPEPVLAMANIQGNIVAGFNKDFQTLLYYHIDDASRFKPAIAKLSHLVATAEEVLTFNRLFKQVANRRGYPGTLSSTWINVAFSFAGLAKLRNDAGLFADQSFQSGLVGQALALGDTTDPGKWNVKDGDSDDAADVLIIVAADTEADVEAEVKRVKELIEEAGGATQLGHDEKGKNRSKPMAGHEHFGFLDGISQPGLRGRASDDPTDLLTPRQNPQDRSQGKPGQELIWPGEFVFGYPDQDASRDGNERGGDSSIDGAGYPRVPNWAGDGSYLVFRRFRQDVHEFHKFLQAEGKARGVSAELVGARLVGRWASGAPVMRAPTQDNTELANNDCANNHFGFKEQTERIAGGASSECPRDIFSPAGADPNGEVCPYTAHIRRANPRDDIAPAIRRRHRLLRRGICFGESSASTPDAPSKDAAERGLLFLAYMTSIVDQFEFITKEWLNNSDFPGKGAGVDALLGQPGKSWVVPTGGGYYFAPSVFALKVVLSR
ncbi:Dyp-type peroxidase [Mesorhizobium sp. AR10]|uniref:Dyp-type peroxidase n=1 Tax=Mesorhizobium sp. AR10 TaxID=2865839 RepID=UPI00216014E7|nr:Dyp-type peroxidase [Mesorhizobium sp. AR10]UVK41273.1 Dyp-type peroxidase [Mesorhizobium sp. AR10]